MRKTSITTLAAAALLLGTAALTTAPAYAEAPMVKSQAPGYYRTMLGDFEVTALSDGTVKLHVKSILRKLGVRSRVEAAVTAVEYGLGRNRRPSGPATGA